MLQRKSNYSQKASNICFGKTTKGLSLLPSHDPLDLWHQIKRRDTLSFTAAETWHQGYRISLSRSTTPMACPTGHVLYQIYLKLSDSQLLKERKPSEDMVWMCEDWCLSVMPSWTTRQRCMGIAWWCQPHRMGHGQHLTLEWIWIDWWFPLYCDAIRLNNPIHSSFFMKLYIHIGCTFLVIIQVIQM